MPADPQTPTPQDRTMPLGLGGDPGPTDFTLAQALPDAFGDYELLDEIGRGGMGVVYRARQKSLGRVVALKTILPEVAGGPVAVKRFRKEALAAAQLDHPSIVHVYDSGEHDGQLYFTMAYVPGRGLDARIKQGPLDNRLAATVVQKVAEAVDYAHSRGVVHRDLKPANVLLTRDGEVKVTDFGIARRLTDRPDSAIERVTDEPVSSTRQKLTGAGSAMGTPGYMAPEQARDASAVGPAADVWSLGAILYACLTGRPPFLGASALETLTLAAAADPVPPELLNPDADRDLVDICLRCLEKEPGDRWATAGELAAALRRWRQGRPDRSRWTELATRAGRAAAAAADFAPLVAGLLVHRLGNIQEGLFVGCALAGVRLATRRGGPGPAILAAAASLLFVVPLAAGAIVGDAGALPLAYGASAAGLAAGAAALAAGLGELDAPRARRVAVGGLVAAAVGLVLAVLVALEAGQLRAALSPGGPTRDYIATRTPLVRVGSIFGSFVLFLGAVALVGAGLLRAARFVPRRRDRQLFYLAGGAVVALVALWLGVALAGVCADLLTPGGRLDLAPAGPWYRGVTWLDRHLGRAASWGLAVALGLAVGALLGRVAVWPRTTRRPPLGPVLGAALAAVVMAVVYREVRPEEGAQTGRFPFLGPGPALAIAEDRVAAWLSPDVRWAAAAGVFWLKLLLLAVPLTAGALLGRLGAHWARGEGER